MVSLSHSSVEFVQVDLRFRYFGEFGDTSIEPLLQNVDLPLDLVGVSLIRVGLAIRRLRSAVGWHLVLTTANLLYVQLGRVYASGLLNNDKL